MAESIFKKHQLDITVDVELNDAQRKATNVKIKNMANEWQDLLDDAIKQGIEQGTKSASLKDVLTQFNAQLKAFKLEPLTITVDELQVMDKPIEHAAKLVIQKLGDSFKGGGLGNIISEEITDSLNVLSGTVDKIYQKMERGAKKSALNIAKSMREIEEAAGRYTKKGDMKILDSVLRVGVTSGKAQKNAQGSYEKSVSTAQSDASWDQKYAADVAFVRNYEALDEKLRKEVFGAQLVEVEKYYAKLAAVHQDKMTALNNILAQNDYIGAQKTKNPVKYQFKGIEPWAQEKTLQEIKNILSGGLTVKGDNNGSSGDGENPNKRNTKVPPADSADVAAAEQAKKLEEERLRLAEQRRIEQEKIAEMLKKEILANARHVSAKKIYRTVYSPLDEENLSREERKAQYGGAEIWTSSSEVANTYADGEDDPVMLKGSLSANNAYIIDANGATWKDFGKMKVLTPDGVDEKNQVQFSKTMLRDEFPELFHKIDNGEFSYEEDIQAELYKAIKSLGYDALVTKNVIDAKDIEGYKEPSTIYAVFDDNALEVLGAYAVEEQDEYGTTSFEKKAHRENIPEYYKMPEHTQEEMNSSLTEETTLLEKIQRLTSYIDDNYLSSGKHLSDFLDDVQRESNELDGELKEILTTLNLIDDKGNLKFDIKHNGEAGGGTTHNGALISDDFVLIERSGYESVKNSHLPDSTQNAAKDGVNVAEVLGYLPSKYAGGFFDIQGTAKGHNLFENGVLSQDVVNATDEQLEQLVQAFIKARDYGFDIENGGSNIVYDKEKGFSFYDLEELSVDDAEFWNSKTEAEKKLDALENLFSLFSGLNRDHTNFAEDVNAGAFAERIKGVVKDKGIVDPNAVDASGRNYEDVYDDVFSGNIDDEYDDVVALLQAEADAHKQNAAAIKEENKAQEEVNQSFLDGVLAAARARTGLEDVEIDSSAEVAAEKAETDAINQQNDALKENIDLKERANEPNIETVPKTEPSADITNTSAGSIEVKASIEPEELRGLLDSITYKVQVIQNTEPTDDNKVSINVDELKSVLDGITYNVKLAQGESDGESNKIAIDESVLENVLNRVTYDVKIAHDDADKTANKIAIDESVLEGTLNRVFGNILTPKDGDKKPERKKEPWALEKTLSTTIKGILDQIQTNTAKPESIEVTPAKTEVGNVLATENTLVAIKTAVEAINSKVVKGTKAKTSESNGKKTGVGKKNAESYDGSRYFPEKLKTQTMQLAKFRAQLMTTGKLTDDVDAQIYELLNGLKQVQNGPDFSEWSQKFQQLKTSVGITDIFDKVEDKGIEASYKQLIEFQKTRNKLELQYEKAEDGSTLKQFYAEQLAQMDNIIAKQEEMLENEEYEAKLAKMREEQARKLGETEAKSADKNAKKRAASAKKLAQREAMLGKAGSAVGRAETTWMNAVGIEGLPPSFVADIDEYYNKLDALRKKHQELKNSDMISEEQKNELIKQTMEINKMTDDIGELVSEYQKLSGDNATVIGTNTLGANAGLSAYEQQLKQTVMTATNGKAQIKNFDAATRTLTYTVKTGKNEFTEYTAAVRRADDALVSVQGATKKTETFFEATKRKMKEISSYMSGMSLISRLGQELKRGIQYVRDIDLALTELKKVTDETEASYDKFLETAAKTADKVGSTIQKVVSSTADWARLGYSMKEAAEFAESTQILMNVSEFTDVAQATDTLISAVQAFEYTADTSMDVVDLINTIGNNYAISTADLAKSLTKSSASLVAAGGDLAEAAALTATANAIVQDAESVGTALKTTSLRLRGTSVEVLEEEGVDSDGAVESTSKLQSKVKALSGVDILTETGEYKSTYQILSQIADVWEDINDMDQAALLELLAGKRNASVLAAILQSPKELKEAYEDAANAEGSALQENEKYLDSIQGRIDQFNNAVQTMWSNALQDDVVKGFVKFGTILVKVIDKIGVLGSLLAALAVGKMIKDKTGPIGLLSNIIQSTADLSTKLQNLKGTFKSSFTPLKQTLSDIVAKQMELRAASLAAKVNSGEIVASDMAQVASKMKLTGSIATLNAAQVSQAMITNGVSREQRLAVIQALALDGSNKAVTLSALQSAMATAGIAPATATAILTETGLTATNYGLSASFMALWTAMWPVLVIMLALAATAGVIALFAHFIKTTDELAEELSDLKSELEDVQSEIDSLNDELETTQERMAELIAMGSLTFAEQEELENLRKENEELERKINLLKQEEKYTKQRIDDKFVETMESDAESTYGLFGKNTWWKDLITSVGGELFGVGLLGMGPISGFVAPTAISRGDEQSQDEKINAELENYQSKSKEIAKLEKELLALDSDSEDYAETKEKIETLKEERNDSREFLDGISENWSGYADGVEYGDNEEVNAMLDKIYNFENRKSIAMGDSDTAISDAITNVLNREQFSEVSDEIDNAVERLKQDPGNTAIKQEIKSIIKANDELKSALEASGVTVDDVYNNFTQLAKEANYKTIPGKIKELDQASEKFENLINGTKYDFNGENIGLQDLFDEEGKVAQDKLSHIFTDTSKETREGITKLLEDNYDQIKDGTVDVDKLLSGFAIQSSNQIISIQKALLSEKNLEMFPGLKDEIDGIIDKFDEFAAAVGDVVDAMDTLEQARAEEAYSGSISIETLENLMKYTDDYTQLVEIDETGAIRLSADAEKILIEQRIQKIKTDAAAAVQTAQTNLAQAEYNAKSINETGPVQEALTAATDGLAGAWSYLGSIIGDIADGNFSGMFDRASAAYSNATAGREEKRAQINVSVEDAQKALDKALNQQKIADSLTSDNIKIKTSSEEASGGADDPKEVAENKFQAAMDYWENRIAANQARYEQIQSEIDLLESQGKKAGPEYYQEQIGLESERLRLLELQRDEAKRYLGSFEEGSDEWWEVANTLNDIEAEIDDVTASIVDLQDATGEIDTYKFEEFNKRLDDITSKLGTIRDLIAPDGEEDWFDEQGNWTEEGVAVLGTYIQDLETYKNGLAETQEELKKYSKPYEGNENYYASLGIHSEQEYYDKTEELIDQQYDYAQSISDTEQEIVGMYESNIDAVEEYTQTLVDSYNDYIDSVKEALDAERDLYDFKKKIKNQTKEIASIERRIASLSGSTNASDIAERRRLEADLYGAREELDDTYYEHAKETQQTALDEEAAAYEETMNRFIEGLRTSLDTATADMDSFLSGVTTMVMYNADTVLTKYQETNLPLTTELTNPWIKAKEAVGTYSGNALALMNQWTEKDGFFAQFNSTGTTNLKSPWTAGTTAANAFKTSVSTTMSNVVSNISSNVKTASSELSKLYQQIKDTEKKAASTKITPSGGGGGSPEVDNRTGFLGLGLDDTTAQKKEEARKAAQDYVDKKGFSEGDKARWGQDANFLPLLRNLINAGGSINDLKGKVYKQVLNSGTISGYSVSGLGGVHWGADDFTLTIGGTGYKLKTNHDEVSSSTAAQLKDVVSNPSKNTVAMLNKQLYVYYGGTQKSWRSILSSGDYAKAVTAWYNKLNGYAKGTTGTTRDEWAITDEPQFGDELVLVPGKDGNLSFMRKGTGVVPADLTQKLFELAQIPTSDLMNKNLTAIVPNITRNDFKNEFNFESLVHVDTVDSDTLPKLEKMVDKKIDDFSKSLNYSLKKFTR